MENIMRENTLYLNTWLDYNPSLKENLSLIGNELIYKENNIENKIDISNFYLPEMLYNESFRQKISQENELTALDLFEIIECYVKTNEILEARQKELANSPTIEEIKVVNKNNEEFIAIIDNEQHKYRFDTKEPERMINIYNELKEKKQKVTLKEFGSVIKNGE